MRICIEDPAGQYQLCRLRAGRRSHGRERHGRHDPWHGKAFLIACGNASQYGNNAYIAPQATLTDGLLDVTILEPFTVLDVPSLAFQLFNKTIDQNSRIKTFRCKQLCIRFHGVTIKMHDARSSPADAQLLAAESLDTAILIDCFIE